MKARPILRYVVACVLVACATACGGSDRPRDPAAPTTFNTPPPAPPPSPPPPPPPPGEVTYTVLDGWTREPVPGAVVNANGEQTRTDAAGLVRLFTTPPHCLRVQVLALGFLERSTCALPEITLWPIVNSDDREATRIAAFGYVDSITTTGRVMPIGVNLGAYRPDVLRVWRAAADEIRELTSGGVIFNFDVVGFAEGTILVTPGSADGCAKSNLKPTETFGFCWDPRVLDGRIHCSRGPLRRSGRGSPRARERPDLPASGSGSHEPEPAVPRVLDIRAQDPANDRSAPGIRSLARLRPVLKSRLTGESSCAR